MKAGNLVGRGENTLLTTISQINPIVFRVGVTEADYLRVFKRRQDAAGKDPVGAQIELTLADNTVYPHKGRLGPIERAIDPTSGTLYYDADVTQPGYTVMAQVQPGANVTAADIQVTDSSGGTQA